MYSCSVCLDLIDDETLLFASPPQIKSCDNHDVLLKNMTCQLWKELVIKMMIHDKSYLLPPFGSCKIYLYTGLACNRCLPFCCMQLLDCYAHARHLLATFDIWNFQIQYDIGIWRVLVKLLDIYFSLLSNQGPFANGQKVM